MNSSKINKMFGSSAVDGKRLLESNAFSIRGTYFRLGCVKVPRIEKAFDSRNLLPSTALGPNVLFLLTMAFLTIFR